MNEHVFDLARQSGAKDEHGNHAKEVFCFTKAELENFAKTLILKCASISANHWEGTAGAFAILEHFGVEE